MRLNELMRSGGVVGAVVALAAALFLTAYGVTEEVPVGTVRGVATFEGTDKPFVNAEVYFENYIDSGDIAGLVTYRTKTDDQGRFVFRNVPQGYAMLRAYAPGYSSETVVNVGEKAETTELALYWKGDELQISTNQPVFTPTESPQIVVNGMTRLKELTIKIFAFSDTEVFEKRDTYSLARNITYGRYDGSIKPENEPKPQQTISYRIRSRDVQGKFADVVSLPPLKEGIYIVRVSGDQTEQHVWLNVSKLGLIAKVSPKDVMAYVVDIETGRPLPGVDVSLVGSKGKRLIGKTNEEGTVRTTERPESDANYVLVASQGDSRAFTMFNWWNDSDGEAAATHFTTDRTIYRPGDTVQYKGFVRVPGLGGFKLPTYRDVKVTVYDPTDTEIKSETLPLTAMGSFNGSFETLTEATGSYRLEVEIDGQTESEWIPVSAYRKPEFRITVTPEKKYYVRGEPARFKVKAEYFTGEPVVGAELSAYATRSDVWRWSPFDDEEYDFWAEESDDYSPYGGESVGDFASATDENGEAVITVPTSQPDSDGKDDWWYVERDQIYSLSVSGTDPSGRYFDGDGKVDVVRSEIELSVAFEDYVVAPGHAITARIRATHHADGTPYTGVVRTELGRREWQVRRSRDVKENEQNVQLDSNGEALVTLTPKQSGDYYLRVATKDSQNRQSIDRDYLWVYQSGTTMGGPAPKLQVVLDKKKYAVGDTVTAVVRTDRPGGSALVTVEAFDVLWSKIVPLDTETNTVTFPVNDQFRPNAVVTVAYIRDKNYSQASRTLVVDMENDRLDVEVTPSTDVTLPGGTVSYQVTTKDAKGNPVSADVALSVVDEGVYSIREDHSDPVKSFFPRRWSSVSTYYSFPEVYLDGDDKSPVDLQVRSDFRDTAFWTPSLVTNDDGTAQVTVKLPENLTSWRTTATAVTAGAKAGKGRADVIARKPVMVRLSPPAYMVQDESQTVGVSVSNETGREQQFDVRIQAEGIRVEGSAVQRVRIDAGSAGRVTWNLTAESPGRATVRVMAVASSTGENDGLERTFEVKTNGPTLESFGAGDTTSSGSMSLRVADGAVGGELTIKVSPSILASVVGSLDALVDYPYGCVEQTMSRFMPAVVVAQYLRETGSSDPHLEAKIADVAAQSQARLKSMQHSDGSFGWWQYDEGDLGMTAYVLEGLYQASQAGVTVDVNMRDRAIEWAKSNLKEQPVTYSWRDDSARMAYALALNGVDVSVWGEMVRNRTEKDIDAEELAYVVLALSTAKGSLPAALEKLKASSYKKLLSSATETDTTMSWSTEYWYEPTAVALQAVLRAEPKSPRAIKVLRYLGSHKRGDYWTSTRDTAQIVLAAIAFLRTQSEAKPSFEAVVRVGGKVVGTTLFEASSARELNVTVPVSQLAKGDNVIEVRVNGQGRAYYTAALKQTVYDPRPAATDSGHGLKIKREFYRMQSRRLEDGTLRLVPSNRPVTNARAGEVLHCRLTITSDRERQYVMVTDPALSNAHPIDVGEIGEYEWYYWWSNQSFLDDHAAIFMTWVQKGENVVEYSVRAEAVGTSIALPATVSMMYQPDVRSTTGTYRLEVRP